MDREVDDALFPPFVAQQLPQPDEAPIREHPRAEFKRRRVVAEKVAVREVAVVEDEGIVEARQVDDKEGGEYGRQPDQLGSGNPHGIPGMRSPACSLYRLLYH